MAESADAGRTDERDTSERFRHLPDRVRLEDTSTTQDSPPQDPQMGRDTERDFMLRYGAG